MDRYFTINNKKIFTEILGEESSPAVLYIHGGPGTGSFDFSYIQGKSLAKYFRLVLVDQRGVLRSEHLSDEDTLSPYDIIEDFEAIRKELGIKKWNIICHSFGGYLTLLYCSKYPSSIEKIVFECPSFDFGLSLRELLRGSAGEYRNMGNISKALECENLASSNMTTEELWNKIDIMNELGENRRNLYVHTGNKTFMDEIGESLNIEENAWMGAVKHLEKLIEDGSMFKSELHLLKELKSPSLLITGQYDHVTCKNQIESFKNDVVNEKHIEFKDSAHFPRYEQPEEYSNVVIHWLLSEH